MKKRDRVFAAIRGEEVDHVPCGFSLHFPHDCAFGDASVEAHLRFFKETDTDIIKIMNENLVPDVGEKDSFLFNEGWIHAEADGAYRKDPCKGRSECIFTWNTSWYLCISDPSD